MDKVKAMVLSADSAIQQLETQEAAKSYLKKYSSKVCDCEHKITHVKPPQAK